MRHSSPIITEGSFTVAMLYPFLPISEVAKESGWDERKVRNFAWKWQLKRENFHWTLEEDKYLLANYGKPHSSINDIASELLKTRWAVINRYRELTGLRAKR